MVMGLVGCGESGKAQKAVKGSLKDPDSAIFQNTKASCGEVNAKNSYGGYTGFKKFYVSDGVAHMEEDGLGFMLGWKAHCEIKNKLDDHSLDNCVGLSEVGASFIRSREAGVLMERSKEVTKSAIGDGDMSIYNTVISQAYIQHKNLNETQFALQVLGDCLSGKIKPPKD